MLASSAQRCALLCALLSGCAAVPSALDDLGGLPSALDDGGVFDAAAFDESGAKHAEVLRAALREGFDGWDTNDDGKLDRAELTARLRGVANERFENERRHTEADAERAWGNLTAAAAPGGGDADGDGKLSLAELRAVRAAIMGWKEEEQAVEELPAIAGTLQQRFHYLSPFKDEDEEAGAAAGAGEASANEHLFELAFRFADADADGALARAEMGDLVNPLGSERKRAYFALTAEADFSRADAAPRDGRVSLAEYLAKVSGGMAPGEAQRLAADGGAAATADPQHAPAVLMFGHADGDGDGALSPAEFAAMEFPGAEAVSGAEAVAHGGAGDEAAVRPPLGLGGAGGERFAYVEAELSYLFEHDEDGDGFMTLAELEANVLNVGHSLHHDEF